MLNNTPNKMQLICHTDKTENLSDFSSAELGAGASGAGAGAVWIGAGATGTAGLFCWIVMGSIDESEFEIVNPLTKTNTIIPIEKPQVNFSTMSVVLATPNICPALLDENSPLNPPPFGF